MINDILLELGRKLVVFFKLMICNATIYSLQHICLLELFRPTREFLTHIGDVIITGEGLHILTYAGHS